MQTLSRTQIEASKNRDNVLLVIHRDLCVGGEDMHTTSIMFSLTMTASQLCPFARAIAFLHRPYNIVSSLAFAGQA